MTAANIVAPAPTTVIAWLFPGRTQLAKSERRDRETFDDQRDRFEELFEHDDDPDDDERDD